MRIPAITLLIFFLITCGRQKKDDTYTVSITNDSDYPLEIYLSIDEESVENGCDGQTTGQREFVVPPHKTEDHTISMKCEFTGYNYYSTSFALQMPNTFVYTWGFEGLKKPLSENEEIWIVSDGLDPIKTSLIKKESISLPEITHQFATPSTISKAELKLNGSEAVPARLVSSKAIQVVLESAISVELALPKELFESLPKDGRIEGNLIFFKKKNPYLLSAFIHPSPQSLSLNCNNDCCIAM